MWLNGHFKELTGTILQSPRLSTFWFSFHSYNILLLTWLCCMCHWWQLDVLLNVFVACWQTSQLPQIACIVFTANRVVAKFVRTSVKNTSSFKSTQRVHIILKKHVNSLCKTQIHLINVILLFYSYVRKYLPNNIPCNGLWFIWNISLGQAPLIFFRHLRACAM